MNTFLISDTHFNHANILTFTRQDGTPLRPFSSMEEMLSEITDRWNSIVKPGDKVYHLGDVAFKNASSLKIFSSLNGTKVLIKGNHDILKPNTYLEYFKDIRAYHVLDKILLAHIPIHPDSLSRWKGQVHGHTHNNCLPDKRYYNVSVENINYTPVPFEVIRNYFNTLDTGRKEVQADAH